MIMPRAESDDHILVEIEYHNHSYPLGSYSERQDDANALFVHMSWSGGSRRVSAICLRSTRIFSAVRASIPKNIIDLFLTPITFTTTVQVLVRTAHIDLLLTTYLVAGVLMMERH